MKEDRKAQEKWEAEHQQRLKDSAINAAKERYWDSSKIVDETRMQSIEENIDRAIENGKLKKEDVDRIHTIAKKQTDETITEITNTFDPNVLKRQRDSLKRARQSKGWPD